MSSNTMNTTKTRMDYYLITYPYQNAGDGFDEACFVDGPFRTKEEALRFLKKDSLRGAAECWGRGHDGEFGDFLLVCRVAAIGVAVTDGGTKAVLTNRPSNLRYGKCVNA